MQKIKGLPEWRILDRIDLYPLNADRSFIVLYLYMDCIILYGFIAWWMYILYYYFDLIISISGVLYTTLIINYFCE